MATVLAALPGAPVLGLVSFNAGSIPAPAYWPAVLDDEVSAVLGPRVRGVDILNSHTLRVYFSEEPAFRGPLSSVSAENPDNYVLTDGEGASYLVKLVSNAVDRTGEHPSLTGVFSVDISVGVVLDRAKIWTVTVSGVYDRARVFPVAEPPYNAAVAVGSSALVRLRPEGPDVHVARR